MFAMLAVGLIAFGLVLQHEIAGGPRDMRDDRIEGPFRATVAVDGSVEFGPAIQALHRGEAFGWANSFCALPQAGLLLQARLINRATNNVVLYRERMLDADAMGCSSSRWDIVLPATIPPGSYQLQRLALLTPKSGTPRIAQLRPLAVQILP